MTCTPRLPDTPYRPGRHARPMLLSGALAMMIVLAQTLGLVHGVGHGAAPASHAVHAAPGAQTIEQPDGGEHHGLHGHGTGTAYGWLHQLLSGHAAGSDCLGFDHAVAGDLLSSAPAWRPPAVAPDSAVADARRVWQLAAQAAGYLARGPPLRS
jgi:hypothetical protein